MGKGDFLDPLYPNRIVDVPQLVDRVWRGNDAVLENRALHDSALTA
jgi:hypothetical protein